MNLTTIVGLLLAWGSVVASVKMDGGHLSAFFLASPAVLVIGGTFGAVMMGMSMDEVKAIPKYFGMVMKNPGVDLPGTITKLAELALRSRRDGILALENDIEQLTDPFMKKGFQLCVDGVDADKLMETMEIEFNTAKMGYKEGEEFFKQLGGFSPTLGIIGTVLGLIHMLSNLEDAASMGPAISMAFIATMYGVSLANLTYLPFGNKMKNISTRLLLQKRIVIQALIGIQGGVSPRVLEESMWSYVHEHERHAAGAEKKKG